MIISTIKKSRITRLHTDNRAGLHRKPVTLTTGLWDKTH